MQNAQRASLWLVMVLLAWLAVPVSAAERAWRELKTPRFTVLSQLEDRQTREWAIEFNEFIDTAQGVLQSNDRNLPPPLTLLLFGSDSAFQPYKPPGPDGKAANAVAGVFERQETWAVAGMSGRNLPAQSRHTLFHEGMHWLASADTSARPTWLSEGLAELFGTFARDGKSVQLAYPIPDHVLRMRQLSLLPMEQLLTARSSLLEKERQTAMFYAQSWALVHYLLMSGDAGRRDQWRSYLSLYQIKTPEVAAHEAFGADLAPLERDLSRYIERSRMGYMKLDRPAPRDVPDPVPASPLQVEVALGRLALVSADKDLAARHLAAAQRLDEQAPGPFELQAALALRNQDRAASASAARRAVIAGSTDAMMYLLIARDLQRNDTANDPTRWDRSAELCAQAINGNPRVLAGYQLLALALQHVEKRAADYEPFIVLGRKLFPLEGDLVFAHLRLLRSLGRISDAQDLMTRALNGDAGLDKYEIERARALRGDWVGHDLSDQYRDLVGKGQFAQLRQVIADYGPQLDSDRLKSMAAQMLRSADDIELVTRADQLRREGKTTEARALYETLQARDGLPPQMRDYLQRTLAALKSPAAARPQK